MILRSKLFTLFLFFCLSANVWAQVTANFSASPTSGCSPLLVQFTDLSTGSPTSWNWDFGNGNTSLQQNPSAIYITPGQYTVKLTASKSGSSDTKTKAFFITVFAEPSSNFTANNTAGCLPVKVNFTDASTKGSGNITSWLWDFGDGSTSTLQNPTHAYIAAGNYTIKLKVTDSNGCSNTFSAANFVNVLAASNSVISFTPSPTVACNPPATVNFTNSSTGAGLTYNWDFGDGGTSNATSPTHVYFSAGTFSVMLIATNSNGCKDTLKRTVSIITSPSVAFSSNKTQGCIGQPVVFADATTPTANSWQWSFGDGNTSTVQSPSHTYNLPGTYDVSLTVNYTNSTCTGTLKKNGYVTISPTAIASFTSDSSGCQIPQSILFTNTSSNANSYQWFFGDGGTSTSASPNHVYTQEGIYTIKLIASNPSGCNDTLTKVNYIRVKKTQVGIATDVKSGCAPLAVQFTDSSSSVSPIVDWQWDFADGSSASGSNPSHTFAVEGVYPVKLKVTNSLGCIDSTTLIIKAGNKPSANFSATPLIACASDTIKFSDLSTHVNSWHWYYGDGGEDTIQNPPHQYRDTGFFDVRLVVAFNGCIDSLRLKNYIYIYPPVAKFSLKQDCKNRNLVTFHQFSINADSFDWDYGDGTVSTTGNDTTHLYAQDGVYTIRLAVKNNKTGCVDTARTSVIIQPFKALFNAVNSVGCKPLQVTFKDSSSGALSWNWDFGDGSTSSSNGTFTHMYLNDGSYNVRLIIGDQYGCKDTLVQPNFVTVKKISANFTDSIFGCTTANVAFKDSSLPVGGINTWLWDFGDGATSNSPSPTHTYTVQDTFTVKLTVSNVTGCSSVFSKPVILRLPTASSSDFFINDSIHCPNEFFIFTAKKTDPSFKYVWDFGDGSAKDTITQPAHVYAALGTYTVSFTVSNSYGCVSTTTKKMFVQKPLVNFKADTTKRSCPVLQVNFTDLSSANIESWKWYFGDGTNSSFQNPTHLYNLPGKYDVTLVAKTASGCSDSITFPEYIQVGGPSGSFTFIPQTGCPPLLVNFNGFSSGLLNYTWDYGDGNLGSGQNSNHSYNVAGVYHPLLILKDSSGCTVSEASPDSIVVTLLAVNAGSDLKICLGDSIKLNGSGAGTQFTWTPAAGLSNVNNAQPIAKPVKTTTYYLNTTLGGCSSVDSVIVFVNPYSPKVQFAATNVCLGDSISFTNQTTLSSGNVISWFWNFGDNTNSNKQAATHFCKTAGSYTVTLTATSDSGCTASTSNIVNVYPVPVASFFNNPVCENVPVLFTDSSKVAGGTINAWKWIFGSGTSGSTSKNTSFSYPSPGTYTVSLIVTSNKGCTDTLAKPIQIDPAPQVAFKPAFAGACVGNALDFFDSTLIASGALSSWLWDFGDGTKSALQNPSHTYAAVGKYTIKLTVKSSAGCTATAQADTLIEVSPSPNAAFIFDPKETNQLQSLISFFDKSTGAVKWWWNFGDGDTSSLINPKHEYQDSGSYTITLVIMNQYNCPDTAKGKVHITPDYTFYIPDAFTPNGDGVNDVFKYSGINILAQAFKFRIFDRWGALVFQSEDPAVGWDGKANYGSKLAQQDIYYWTVDYTDVFKRAHSTNGHVTLVK